MISSGAIAAMSPKIVSLAAFEKSNAVPLVGLTSLSIGLAEATSDGLGGMLAPLNIAAGGVVMVLFFFGKGLLRIAEKWLDSQGEKLIALPTAAQLKADKDSLFEKLENFGKAAEGERKEMAKFREGLAATIADYGARIKNVEEAVKGLEAAS